MGDRKLKKHLKFQMWHAMWSSGLHIYLLWFQGPQNDLYLKEYFQKIMTFLINMIRRIKKHIKFQMWHIIWSSGQHIYLLLTFGSSIWLIFERIFSNHPYLHNRYDKEWEKGRSKSILNFKHDMLFKV